MKKSLHIWWSELHRVHYDNELVTEMEHYFYVSSGINGFPGSLSFPQVEPSNSGMSSDLGLA